MIIIIDKNISSENYNTIENELRRNSFKVIQSNTKDRIVLTVYDVPAGFDVRNIKVLDGVIDVIKLTDSYQLVSRRVKAENTIIKLKDIVIGGEEIIIIAGPCSVESEEQIHNLAKLLKKSGTKILRGGAFKPRTSPYSFQGLGVDALKFLRSAADENNMLMITEIIDPSQFDIIEKYTDLFQVGSRNMYNYSLLKILSKTQKPVLLKRGMSATIDEWLMSAEYLLAGGNPNVILCERGIRTFENSSRFTFDLSSIVTIHEKSHLPVCSDPSHATGYRNKVFAIARAAVAANTDLLMIEVHHNPPLALSDGPQSITPSEFDNLMEQIIKIAPIIGRKIG